MGCKKHEWEKIGAVEELILDAQEKKVRYMAVDLDDNELKLDHKKVLIPIGLAELHEHDDDVLIPNISAQQIEQLPDYDKNNLTGDVERRVCSILGRQTGSAAAHQEYAKFQPKPTVKSTDAPIKETERQRENRAKEERQAKKQEEKKETDPDFYRHEYYNLDNLYKNRLHEVQPAKNKNESEYERGLRLWERRSEGGLIPGDKSHEASGQPSREGRSNYREMDEEARMEMVRNRRNNYQHRRYNDGTKAEQRNENSSERKRDKDLNL